MRESEREIAIYLLIPLLVNDRSVFHQGHHANDMLPRKCSAGLCWQTSVTSRMINVLSGVSSTRKSFLRARPRLTDLRRWYTGVVQIRHLVYIITLGPLR